MVACTLLCFLTCYCYVGKCADVFKFTEGLEMLIITTGILEIRVKTEKNKEKNSKLDNKFDKITQKEVQRIKDKNIRRD